MASLGTAFVPLDFYIKLNADYALVKRKENEGAPSASFAFLSLYLAIHPTHPISLSSTGFRSSSPIFVVMSFDDFSRLNSFSAPFSSFACCRQKHSSAHRRRVASIGHFG